MTDHPIPFPAFGRWPLLLRAAWERVRATPEQRDALEEALQLAYEFGFKVGREHERDVRKASS